MVKTGIQLFIENLVATFLSLIKVLLLSNIWLKKIKPVKDQMQECVIIGNGPSLKKSMEENFTHLINKDLFVVNFFWKSEYYSQLKPKNYVIISRSYWKDADNFNYNERKIAFAEIARRTTWKMTLFVPSFARKQKDWQETINSNTNITIKFINVSPVSGFKGFVMWALKSNIGLPRPHNVLIPSVKIAIDMRYEKAYLLGADHSWHKELYLDENNVIFLNHKHFYNEDETGRLEPMKEFGGKYNMGRALYLFYNTFNSYYVLETYSKKQNVKVLNATPGSFIDAFSRAKTIE